MTTITEDYCSFEVAKLLKEKGFDADIDFWYDENGDTFICHKYDIKNTWRARQKQEVYLCPTLQMSIKWLREVHNIHIYTIDTFIGFKYVIQDMFHHDEDIHPIDGICFSSNEEACEAAIKYCLEHLI